MLRTITVTRPLLRRSGACGGPWRAGPMAALVGCQALDTVSRGLNLKESCQSLPLATRYSAVGPPPPWRSPAQRENFHPDADLRERPSGLSGNDRSCWPSAMRGARCPSSTGWSPVHRPWAKNKPRDVTASPGKIFTGIRGPSARLATGSVRSFRP